MLRTALIFFLIATPVHAQIMYRPAQEQRTITTEAYGLVIQRNGRIDLRLPNGEVIFDNAYPAVWFDGDDEPSHLPIDGFQTAREPVRDVLGQGQGMLFRKDGGEWVVRTYPSQPFITVQCAFTNDSRRTVTVSRLMPWVVGPPASGALWLGPGTDESIMRPLDSLTVPMDATPGLQRGRGHSGWSLAVLNPRTGRSVIAGFLTDDAGASYIETSEANAEGFQRFRAVTVFDPPVEVPPGGRIESNKLYISVTEPDPVSGLARYGNAFARANNIVRSDVSPWNQWFTQKSLIDTYGSQIVRGTMPLAGRQHPFVAPKRRIAASWNPPSEELGITDAVAWLGSNFHYTPYLARPILMAESTPGVDDPLTDESRLAWYSFCAIVGAPVVAIGDDELDPQWQATMNRLVPSMERPARPADGFVHDFPAVWHTPLPGLEGDAHLVGLFNWNPSTAQSFSINLGSLGMVANSPYAVYDFWDDRYHGNALGSLNIEVPAGACRLMMFRSRLYRPALLADPTHFGMGAAHPGPAEWDEAAGVLSGRAPGTTSRLLLLVPPQYRLLKATAGGSAATVGQDGDLLTLDWAATGGGETAWHAEFTKVE